MDDDIRDLMAGLQAGDPAAAAALYERFGPAVRAAVRRRLHPRLRDKFDSLDFTQDVWASFLTLPPGRCDADTADDLVRYLCRMASNKVTDVFRQRFRTQKYAAHRERPAADGPDVPGTEPTPSQYAIAREEWDRMLARVGPGQRPVLERLRAGETYEDIARTTNVSVSTVNRIVRRLKDRAGL